MLKIKFKKVFKWGFWLLVPVLLLVLFTVASLQTPWGQRLLLGTIEKAVSSRTGFSIALERLEGFPPLSFRLGSMELADAEGFWLQFKQLDFRLGRLSGLFSGVLNVALCRVGEVHLLRLPPAGAVPPPGPAPPASPGALLADLQRVLGMLSVDDLVLERLVLEEPILGQAAEFRLEAMLQAPRAAGGRSGRLDLVRTDGGPALTLRFDVFWQGLNGNLDLDFALHEAPGGALGVILAVEDGIELILSGAGAITDWSGMLLARAGPWGPLELDLDLLRRDKFLLRAQGTAALDRRLLPDAAAAWVGDQNVVEFLLAFEDPARALDLERLVFDTGPARFEACGQMDLRQARLNAVRFHLAADLFPMAEVVGQAVQGQWDLHGELDGPFNQPRLDFRFLLEGLRTAQLSLGRWAGAGDLSLAEPLGGDFRGLQVDGRGTLEGLVLADRPFLAGRVLEWQTSLGGLGTDKLMMDQLVLTAPDQRLVLRGELEPVSMHGALDLHFRSDDLAALTLPWGVDLPAGIEMAAELQALGVQDVRAAFSGHIEGGEALSAQLPVTLARRWQYGGSLRLKADRVLELEALRLSSAGESFSAAGRIEMENNLLDVAWSVRIEDLGPLLAPLELPLQGGVEITGSMQGPLGAPRLQIEARGSDFAAHSVQMPDLLLDGFLEGPWPSAHGRLTLGFGTPSGPLTLRSDYALLPDGAAFEDVELTAPGLQLEGAVTLQNSMLEGAFKGRVEDPVLLEDYWQVRLAGLVDFDLRLLPDAGGQGLKFSVQGHEITGDFGRLAQAGVQGELLRAFSRPRISLRAEARGLTAAGLVMDTFAASLEGTAQRIDFDTRLKGTYERPFSLAASGQLGQDGRRRSLRLERLEGGYGEYPLRLRQPLNVEHGPERLDLERLLLDFGPGQLRATARLDAGSVAADIRITSWPVDGVPPLAARNLKGVLDAAVNIGGPPAGPWLQGELQMQELRLDLPGLADRPPLAVSARVRSIPGGLGLEGAARMAGSEFLTADIQVPVAMSLTPPSVSRLDEHGLEGGLDLDLDLDVLGAVFDLQDQVLQGRLKGGLDLAGTLRAPELRGRLVLEGGRYENLRSGTILQDIVLVLMADGTKVRLVEASARDGGSGTVQGHGRIDLQAEAGLQVRAGVAFKDATLVRMTDATIALSGDLSLAGRPQELALTGNLQVGPADLRIPEKLPREVAQVEVEEINFPPGLSSEPRAEKGAEAAGRLHLDLRVASPGRVFLRGRGLDSEWGGELHVGGTAAAPEVTGTLSLVRGRFDFLGRPFQLKRGRITFDGSVPPEPHLDVVAEAASGDITALLNLYGTPSDLRLVLSSDPPLPSDEILSRVLFRRSAKGLNAAQALQLAAAARNLAGGSGLDFMGRLRRFLDVDQLQLRASEEGNVGDTLAAGKYLGDRVYLEVERGLGPETGKVTVEVEINPRFTWEADVGENSEGGLGLKWRWDY